MKWGAILLPRFQTEMSCKTRGNLRMAWHYTGDN